MRRISTILVTGGLGFIGSNFIHWLLKLPDSLIRIINLDSLTYAGNPENLADIEKRFGSGKTPRYIFIKGDITERSLVEKIFYDYNIDTVVHFAAESHVDRSILGPDAFIKTNVLGTFILLDVAKTSWGFNMPGKGRDDVIFHHVSTDEVFGSLGDSGYFSESTAYDPRSPYSASKASSDHIVKAYYHTYGLPVTISNCSNNYGPYQFPEKFIPLMILNMLEGKPLPVYGDGKNIRDWIYVEDHNEAMWKIMNRGRVGETYNIGGENEWENITLLHRLIEIVAEESGKSVESLKALITYVKDRPGHDRRYAIDCSKIKTELGWKQKFNFDDGLRKTVRWYLENEAWSSRIRSGEYRKWINNNYYAR